MWKMNLKQRRRHGELVKQLDELRRSPYCKVPDGYKYGENEEEDAKYSEALESLKAVLEEMHELDMAVRDMD